jgi:DNA (cytosine-5)-methyltransferase 1
MENEQDGKNIKVGLICGGIGGSSLGYAMTNMQVLVSMDSNAKGNMIHLANFPQIPIIEKSIENISKIDVMGMIGEVCLDILDIYVPTRFIHNGKSPAQESFFQHVIRLVYEIKPKTIVIHTQGRIKSASSVLMINELAGLVKSIGYIVQLETLKTENYAIAQERSWTFMVGVHKKYEIKPLFPEAKENIVSAKDVLEDLLDSGSDIEGNPVRQEIIDKYFPPGCTYAQVKKVVEDLELPVHPAFYKRDRWDAPYYALPNSSTRPFHPIKNRLMNITEAKRLQSFPDNYNCQDWKEICASVPPLLINCMAIALREGILIHL